MLGDNFSSRASLKISLQLFSSLPEHYLFPMTNEINYEWLLPVHPLIKKLNILIILLTVEFFTVII